MRFYGDGVLHKKAKPVKLVTPEIRDLANRMVTTMFARDGIGLAAPQIGQSLRLIVVACMNPTDPVPLRASPGERQLGPLMPLALVNPEIMAHSSETTLCGEGCLSVPEIWGEVERPAIVQVRATMLDGTVVEVLCGGLLGRCLQHEIDHLDGVLFVDRLSKDERERVGTELAALKEQTLSARRKSR